MRAWPVGRVGIHHERERPVLAAAQLRQLVTCEYAKPMYASVGEHATCETADLGAV